MHIVKVLTLTVHDVLEVKARIDGAIQFFVVLTGIAYVSHAGAVHHRRLSDFRKDLFFRLPLDKKAHVDSLTSLYQRGKPA